MSEYVVVIEDVGPNLCAYVPDLPGCVSAGFTIEEVTANIHEAIEMHIEAMVENGEAAPRSTSRAVMVQVAS